MNGPNTETIAAFKEVEDMKRNPSAYHSYSSFSELLDEVKHEI